MYWHPPPILFILLAEIIYQEAKYEEIFICIGDHRIFDSDTALRRRRSFVSGLGMDKRGMDLYRNGSTSPAPAAITAFAKVIKKGEYREKEKKSEYQNK